MLLYLTGGLENPFSILILAPVTVAATVLSLRPVIALAVFAVAVITLLALWHMPLPWRTEPLDFPPELVLGLWTALVLATVFIGGYTWSVAEEARRLRDAVAATQLALAREQRVSAVGALAAAAAHELGSPLATIAVVAKELVHELPPDSPHGEDAQLLLSQSERCRQILAQLAHQPDDEGGASPYTRLPISALVEAAGALYHDPRVRLIFATDRRARRRRAAGPPQPGDHARAQQPDPERGAVRPARGQRHDALGQDAPSRSRSPMTARAFRRICWAGSASLTSRPAPAPRTTWGSAFSSRRACWNAAAPS